MPITERMLNVQERKSGGGVGKVKREEERCARTESGKRDMKQ